MNPQLGNSSSPSQNGALKALLYVAGALIIIFCAYSIVSWVRISQTTGLLKLSADDSRAALSVSQPNHQAQSIGVGSAAVRLLPGNYQVMASDKGSRAIGTVTIAKQQTTSSSLQLSKNTGLPTRQDINFQGISAFSAKGLTALQLDNLEAAFFHFKPTANTVNVDANSLQSGPFDPNSSSITFSLNFAVNIDGTPYKATVVYGVSDNVQLILHSSQTNAQVFSYGNAD